MGYYLFYNNSLTNYMLYIMAHHYPQHNMEQPV